MSALFLKLILAHLAGDFLFQPGKWIEDRNKKKFKSPCLYAHILVHTGLLLLVIQFDFSYWLGLISIVVSHYLIDLSKSYLEQKINSRLLFFIDQILHLLVIASVVYYYYPFEIDIQHLFSYENLLLITFLIIITFVSSTIIKLLITPWKKTTESSNRAGKYIGMLERLFVFFFILLNYWEGIGFLLAAKSVFRFGDLSNAKDRELTEYILIGTLLSFGIAMLSAVAYKYLTGMEGIPSN